jgi:hypothetical protein
MVAITVVLNAPATLWPGTAWLRADTGPTTRAAITRQDLNCPPGGPGNRTCTFNVARGQVVTVVATDQQAEIFFRSTPFNARDEDPRGIRSQFTEFSGPCTTTERGVCTIDASQDQTVIVHNAPLRLTRIKFLGNVNWNFGVTASPTLNVADELHTAVQSANYSPKTPAAAVCVTDPDVAVACFSLVTPGNASIKLEAFPPDGPAPLGATGPLQFVRFDNPCGSNTACTIEGEADIDVTMSWEYYRCPTSASNTGWNYGPVLTGTTCVLTRP